MKLNNDNSKNFSETIFELQKVGFRSILSGRMTLVKFCSQMVSLSFPLFHHILWHDKFTTLLKNLNFSTTELIPSNYLDLNLSINCVQRPMIFFFCTCML